MPSDKREPDPHEDVSRMVREYAAPPPDRQFVDSLGKQLGEEFGTVERAKSSGLPERWVAGLLAATAACLLLSVCILGAGTWIMIARITSEQGHRQSDATVASTPSLPAPTNVAPTTEQAPSSPTHQPRQDESLAKTAIAREPEIERPVPVKQPLSRPGTPAGVGSTSGTFLKPGDEVVGELEGVGKLVSPVA